MKLITKKAAPLNSLYLDLYNTQDYEFYKDKVFINSKGLIFTENHEIFNILKYETMWWLQGFISKHYKGNEEWQKTLTQRELKIKELIKNTNKNLITQGPIDGTIYINLIHTFERYAFGHLLDTLEKILMLEKILPTLQYERVCFLISDTSKISGGVHGYISYIQALLPNISFKVQEVKRGETLYTKNILTIKPLAHPSCISSKENMLEINKRFIKKFKTSTPKKLFSKKLFLTREHPLTRHIINSKSLHEHLLKNNISIISGNEQLEDVFHAFYNAEVIVGYHGASFIYQMFCEKNPKVFEINSSKRFHGSLSEKFFNIDNAYHINVDADVDHNVLLDTNHILELYTKYNFL